MNKKHLLILILAQCQTAWAQPNTDSAVDPQVAVLSKKLAGVQKKLDEVVSYSLWGYGYGYDEAYSMAAQSMLENDLRAKKLSEQGLRLPNPEQIAKESTGNSDRHIQVMLKEQESILIQNGTTKAARDRALLNMRAGWIDGTLAGLSDSDKRGRQILEGTLDSPGYLRVMKAQRTDRVKLAIFDVAKKMGCTGTEAMTAIKKLKITQSSN
jgi:hypothetical protein